MFEKLIIAHVGILCGSATWYLGGGSSGAMVALTSLGGLALLLTLYGMSGQLTHGNATWATFSPLIPLLVFNAIVAAGLFNPSFRLQAIEGAHILVPIHTSPLIPSSARPEAGLRELLLFNALVVSALNVFFFVRRRRLLRTLFLLLVANAFALAVFGTLQKFTGSTGIFFGQISSPNSTFFASFIYHNHWGAYILLMLGVCLGLLFNVRLDSSQRDVWHSPIPIACVAVFFLAVTVPLSGARACTLLSVALVGGALVTGLRRSSEHARAKGHSATIPRLLIAATAIACVSLAYVLARDTLARRIADTRTQLADMRELGGLGSRTTLYRDTVRMVADRPWFGWGLGSYGTVFRSYNTQVSEADNLPVFYEYAHSDWLQLLAETGLSGGICWIVFLALLLGRLRGRRVAPSAGFILLGCGLVVLYAIVEFPFGNPAVALHFWVCLFAAIRWVRLSPASLPPCSPSSS